MSRRYHHDSEFGQGLRSPLNREQRAQWRGRLRWLYQLGRISAKTLLIGLAMLDFLAADGRCDPSHVAIGRRARAGARTVRRALACLSALGMLQWVRRLVRVGDEVRQDTNSYALALPALAGGHGGRGTTQLCDEKKVPAPDQVADRGSLGEIRRAMTERLARAWGGRRAACSQGNRP